MPWYAHYFNFFLPSNQRMGNEPSSPVVVDPSELGDDRDALLKYAKSNYESNPLQALNALIKAMPNKDMAESAMQRIRSELGDDVADGLSQETALERAKNILNELKVDDSAM